MQYHITKHQQTNGQTNKQMNEQQTNKQTNKHTYKHTYKQTKKKYKAKQNKRTNEQTILIKFLFLTLASHHMASPTKPVPVTINKSQATTPVAAATAAPFSAFLRMRGGEKRLADAPLSLIRGKNRLHFIFC
jgi:hypothetical protein